MITSDCRTQSSQPKGDGCHACQAGTMNDETYHEGFNAFFEGAQRIMENPYNLIFQYTKYQDWRRGHMDAESSHINFGVFA